MEAKTVAGNTTHFLSSYLIFVLLVTSCSNTASAKNDTAFVKTACSSTTYPSLCYKSLSSYASAIKADPLKLCKTSLNLNLRVAKHASSIVSELLKNSQIRHQRIETQILSDCVDVINDSIDELKKVIAEVKRISSGGDAGRRERMEDLKTWLSSALTNEDTCTDGFNDVVMMRKKVNAATKKKIEKAVVNLYRMTSNSLALIITTLRF